MDFRRGDRAHRVGRSGQISDLDPDHEGERSSQITESILLNRAHWHNVYPWHTSALRSRSTNLDTSLPPDSAFGPFLSSLSPDRAAASRHLRKKGESVNYDRDKRDTFSLYVTAT